MSQGDMFGGETTTREKVRKLYATLGFRADTCKSCGRQVWWARTLHDKPIPLTDEAQPHFVDCPHAGEHRRNR